MNQTTDLVSPDYELTLYVYPSPFGVDWRSPFHLTRSVVRNALSFRKRAIGHVSVEIKGPGVHRFTGMASVDFNINRRLILWEQLGLGVLFYQYPGEMESKAELLIEKEKRLENGNFSFMRFKISGESYQKIIQYLDEYESRNVGKWYGLPHRPRYGEGAGCSAFGASFLEVAGILDEELKKNGSGRVRVPVFLMTEQNVEKKIPLWKLLIPSKTNLRWAYPEEAGKDIFFWDPDLIHQWILKNQNTSERNAKGVFLDVSSKKPPHEPIWLY